LVEDLTKFGSMNLSINRLKNNFRITYSEHVVSTLLTFFDLNMVTTRNAPKASASKTPKGTKRNLGDNFYDLASAHKKSTKAPKEVSIKDTWLWKIAEGEPTREYISFLHDKSKAFTADEILSQRRPCAICQGHPYGGKWGHATQDCRLLLDDGSMQVNCLVCNDDLTTRSVLCERCGLAACVATCVTGDKCCKLCDITDTTTETESEPQQINLTGEKTTTGVDLMGLMQAGLSAGTSKRKGTNRLETNLGESLHLASGLAGLHMNPVTPMAGEPRLPRHFLMHNASEEATKVSIGADGQLEVKPKGTMRECADLGEYLTGSARLLFFQEKEGMDMQTRHNWMAHTQRVVQFMTAMPFDRCLWYDEQMRRRGSCEFNAEVHAMAFLQQAMSTPGLSVRCDRCGLGHFTGSSECSKSGVQKAAAPKQEQAAKGAQQTSKQHKNNAKGGNSAPLVSVMGGRGFIRGENGKFLTKFDGKELCAFYNQDKCSRANCTKTHACSFCGEEGHPNGQCTATKAF
jgi:hypothetical protein